MRIEDIRRRSEKPNTGSPRALIVVASMPQAQALAWSLKAIAQNLKLGATVVTEGDSAATVSQRLSEGFDLFISLPNTLSTMTFAHTSEIVVDDFEQIADSPLSEIAPAAAPRARLILSTATSHKAEPFLLRYFPAESSKLPANTKLEEKKAVEISPQRFKHSFIPISPKDPNAQLLVALQARKKKIFSQKCIVFCAFLQQVIEIEQLLNQNDFTCAAIHSDLSENTIVRSLWKFKKGLCKVLIVTEVSARKENIPPAELVVNFGLPETSADYAYRAQYARAACITLASTEKQGKWTNYSGANRQVQTESQVLVHSS